MEKTLYQKIEAIVEANPALCIKFKSDLTEHDKKSLKSANEGDIFVWAPRPYGTVMFPLVKTANGLQLKGMQLKKYEPRYFLHDILSWEELRYGAYLLEVKSFQNGEACGDLKMLTRIEKNPSYPLTECSRVGYQIHGPNGSEL